MPEKFKAFWTSRCRYNVAWGGRGSGKSYSFAIIFLLKALQGKCKILCVREIMHSIKESVYETLLIAMDIIGVKHLFDITHNSIICKMNGSTFIFAGLYRNIESIKSIPGINYVWCAEANKISEESLQLLFPTIREADSQIFIEFNPDQETDAVYKRFVANNVPDSLVVNVNWMDNPFISDTLIKEKDTDYAIRPDEAAWIWAGELRRQGMHIWAPPFDRAVHVREFDLRTIPDVRYFQSLDPHTSFYSAAIWAARWKVNDRYYTWIYDEYPRYSDVNADYADIRTKTHYTGTVADLSRAFFARETGKQITQRYIDTRYAKGFGSKQSNLINNTEGLVESFAKPENGGILYLMPPEARIDAARDVIKQALRYNTLAPRDAFNEPSLYISSHCKNVLNSLANHRYEEGNECELETYKDHSDCCRLLIAGLADYKFPAKPKPESSLYARPAGSEGWMG
jgi:hypothetical protein